MGIECSGLGKGVGPKYVCLSLDLIESDLNSGISETQMALCTGP